MGILNYGNTPQRGGGILSYGANNMNDNPVVAPPLEEEKGWFMTALDYLDKPASAVAGAAQYLSGASQDPDLVSAIGRGWETNTDYEPILKQYGIDPESWEGKALNIGGKIIADPLWIATPAKMAGLVGKGAKAVGVADNLAGVGGKIAESKVGQYVGNQIDNLANKQFGDYTGKRWLSEAGPLDAEKDLLQRGQAFEGERIANVANDVAAAPESVRKYVTEYIEAQPDIGKFAGQGLGNDAVSAAKRSEVLQRARESGLDEGLTKQIFDLGEQSAELNNYYTKELTKRGIISGETADKFAGGRHIKREYMKYVNPEEHARILRETGQEAEAMQFEQHLEKLQKYSDSKGYKLNLKAISQRQDLPPEVQLRLGRIMDATHPLAKGGQISADLINKYDFLESVALKHAKTADDIAGLPGAWRQMEGKAYGPLEGLYVPREVFNEVTATVRRLTEPESWWRKAVGYWKYGKVILNPATHARNAMSNAILLNVGGIPFHEVPVYLVKAAQELSRKGDVFNEARGAGNFLLDTFTKNELVRWGGKEPGKLAKAGNKMADLYQGNERIGKMAAYLWAKDKGKSAEEAAKFADHVLFNYSKVPPIIDYLRRTGIVPFASFPYFVATRTLPEVLYRNPAKLSKYYKPVQELQDPNERQMIPEYFNPQNMLPLGKSERMVNGKPQKINNYLDVKNIYPFESGSPGQIGVGPMFDLVAASKTNVNPFNGKEIARKGMTTGDKIGSWAEYLWQMLTPSLTPGNYGYDKLINQGLMGESDYMGRTYGLGEAAAHTLGGLKNTPINLDEAVQKRLRDIDKEQQGAMAEIRSAARDARLTPAEKKEREAEYVAHIRELQQEKQKISNAYKQYKKKEGGK